MTESCIFLGRPPICSVCLDARKLGCLLNHRHLILSKEEKREILQLVAEECDSSQRFKTKSGQEQRR